MRSFLKSDVSEVQKILIDVKKMSSTVEMVNAFMDLVFVMESISAGMELMNLNGEHLSNKLFVIF